MKAIVKTRPEVGFDLLDIEEPVIKTADEIKIKVLQSSICGTDYHIYKWDEWSQNTVKIPHINGHEGLAKVVEIGSNVANVKVGDVIAYETHYYCGHCYQCTTGNAHVCENMKILGVHTNGVWAEYAVIPSNIAFKMDPRIELKYAGLMEPLGNAVHTINYTNVLGKHVLISGNGPISLMAIEVAKNAGAASVTVMSIPGFREEIVKKMNVSAIIHSSNKEEAIETVKKVTGGRMIDVVLEMTGSPQALDFSIDLVRTCGEMNILSVYPTEKIEVRMNEMVFKNLKLQMVTGRRIFDTWHIVNDLLANNILDKSLLDLAITHQFKMEDFEKGFEELAKGNASKIVLKISEDE